MRPYTSKPSLKRSYGQTHTEWEYWGLRKTDFPRRRISYWQGPGHGFGSNGRGFPSMEELAMKVRSDSTQWWQILAQQFNSQGLLGNPDGVKYEVCKGSTPVNSVPVALGEIRQHFAVPRPAPLVPSQYTEAATRFGNFQQGAPTASAFWVQRLPDGRFLSTQDAESPEAVQASLSRYGEAPLRHSWVNSGSPGVSSFPTVQDALVYLKETGQVDQYMPLSRRDSYSLGRNRYLVLQRDPASPGYLVPATLHTYSDWNFGPDGAVLAPHLDASVNSFEELGCQESGRTDQHIEPENHPSTFAYSLIPEWQMRPRAPDRPAQEVLTGYENIAPCHRPSWITLTEDQQQRSMEHWSGLNNRVRLPGLPENIFPRLPLSDRGNHQYRGHANVAYSAELRSKAVDARNPDPPMQQSTREQTHPGTTNSQIDQGPLLNVPRQPKEGDGGNHERNMYLWTKKALGEYKSYQEKLRKPRERPDTDPDAEQRSEFRSLVSEFFSPNGAPGV